MSLINLIPKLDESQKEGIKQYIIAQPTVKLILDNYETINRMFGTNLFKPVKETKEKETIISSAFDEKEPYSHYELGAGDGSLAVAMLKLGELPRGSKITFLEKNLMTIVEKYPVRLGHEVEKNIKELKQNGIAVGFGVIAGSLSGRMSPSTQKLVFVHPHTGDVKKTIEMLTSLFADAAKGKVTEDGEIQLILSNQEERITGEASLFDRQKEIIENALDAGWKLIKNSVINMQPYIDNGYLYVRTDPNPEQGYTFVQAGDHIKMIFRRSK